MKNHFLFVPKQQVSQTRWHLLFVFVLFAISFGFISWRLFPVIAPKIVKGYDVVEYIEFVKGAQPTDHIIGGDITMSPPAIQAPQRPERIGPLPDPELFSAQAIIVKDLKSGALLYNRNAYEPRPIASLTKLMSALVVLEKDIDWNATTTVVGGDSLGTHVYAGEVYTLEELWQAGLVASSNKSIMTLANALGWPEQAVVERMRQKAHELGMIRTTFADTTGLSPENSSSASDIALLLSEALAHEKIRNTLLVPEVTIYDQRDGDDHNMYSTNWLLLGWIKHDLHEIIGGKTGYIPEAGYNFGFQVADEQGHGVSVVVLGTQSHEARFTEARDLATWAFENHKWE